MTNLSREQAERLDAMQAIADLDLEDNLQALADDLDLDLEQAYLERKLRAWQDHAQRTGGLTITPAGHIVKRKAGYAVSLEGYERLASTLAQALALIPSYQALARKLDALIGLWDDGGLWYLDITTIQRSRKRAIQAGRENHQLAIYDLARGEVITL